MTDFEKMCAIYDKADIEYTVGDASMANFYNDEGCTDKAIETCVKKDVASVSGYPGFACHHTFDANGNLLNIYIWE